MSSNSILADQAPQPALLALQQAAPACTTMLLENDIDLCDTRTKRRSRFLEKVDVELGAESTPVVSPSIQDSTGHQNEKANMEAGMFSPTSSPAYSPATPRYPSNGRLVHCTPTEMVQVV